MHWRVADVGVDSPLLSRYVRDDAKYPTRNGWSLPNILNKATNTYRDIVVYAPTSFFTGFFNSKKQKDKKCQRPKPIKIQTKKN